METHELPVSAMYRSYTPATEVLIRQSLQLK